MAAGFRWHVERVFPAPTFTQENPGAPRACSWTGLHERCWQTGQGWQLDRRKNPCSGKILMVTNFADTTRTNYKLCTFYKKQRHPFANKGLYRQSYGVSSGHLWMWELDHKEVWAPKNWCFWTVVLEKTPEGPLDCKEIQPVHPKGDQSWIFTGRTDAEGEAPTLCPPDVKSRLIWNDPDAGKDWGQEEGDDRGWDGWMASPTQWTWVWANLGR